MADIAFLHTSPVHVATFDALLASAAPARSAIHLVREDLLSTARRDGLDDPALACELRTVLHTLAGAARVVVCTCSTLGGLAEATEAPVPVTRIDRAMADAAVQAGAPVLIVAAVESTVPPTRELLQSSGVRLGLPVTLRSLWVAGAWAHFEAGRHDDYLQAIASAVRQSARRGETVVLAQASMAGAAALLADLPLTVLSSPRLGVAQALQRCEGDDGARM